MAKGCERPAWFPYLRRLQHLHAGHILAWRHVLTLRWYLSPGWNWPQARVRSDDSPRHFKPFLRTLQWRVLGFLARLFGAASKRVQITFQVRH
jgi:hypothetical protein